MPAPRMLRSWPLPVRFVLACIVPALFGGLCGYVLGVSAAGYVALSVLGAIGGLLAGMEHDGARAGAVRGVTGGALFGVLLIAVHAVSDATATVVVPHPLVLLVGATAASGSALGAGGGWLQRRFKISSSG